MPISAKRRSGDRADLVEWDAVEAAIARICERCVVERSSRERAAGGGGIGRIDVSRKAATEITAREAAGIVVCGLHCGFRRRLLHRRLGGLQFFERPIAL